MSSLEAHKIEVTKVDNTPPIKSGARNSLSSVDNALLP